MSLLLYFAVTLFFAVLISELAEKSVLSVAVFFLAAGFVAGMGLLGSLPEVNQDLLRRIAELALYSVLFTDGMRTGGLHEIRRHWHLPGRALVIGMPLTVGGVALLAHYLVGVDWVSAVLVGAVVSPTDPVFASSIFRFGAVPERLKHLLNIESGLNDGLALPAVILLLNHVAGVKGGIGGTLWELLLGALIGIAVPWIGIRLEKLRVFGAAGIYKRLNAFALGLLVLGICYATGANLFLGAFCAGITIATASSAVQEAFHEFGETVAELLKLGALLLFGALISPRFFTPLPWTNWLFVVLGVFAVRPVAIGLALAGAGVSRAEMLAAGWFGPKGFASVVYGLLILQHGLNRLAHLVGLMVAISIVVYSSTDILIGQWFERRVQRQDRQQELAHPRL